MATICGICQKACNSPKGLGQHVRKTHHMAKAEYAKIVFTPVFCQCGKHAQLLSICKGWDSWCGAGCGNLRRSLSTVASKAKLKADPVRYELFISRMRLAEVRNASMIYDNTKPETAAVNLWHKRVSRATVDFESLNSMFGI